jgi:hypothetical protein
MSELHIFGEEGMGRQLFNEGSNMADSAAFAVGSVLRAPAPFDSENICLESDSGNTPKCSKGLRVL